MPAKGKVKLLPCPCCGSSNLYIGPQSSSSQGVNCYKCHLKMSREYPDRWPRGHVGDLKYLKEYTLRKAIAAWNKRVN